MIIMKYYKILLSVVFAVLLVFSCAGIFFAAAENEVPIRMIITYDPETRLQTDGTVNELIFTIINDTDNSYTLYDSHLYGGYDGEDRILNDKIIIDAHSSIEFSLHDIYVKDDQLSKDIVYYLSWFEITEVPLEVTPIPTEEKEEEDEVDGDNEEELSEHSTEYEIIKTERTIESTIHIEKFIPPVLTLSAYTSSDAVQAGSTFSVTYVIQNNTKYDMSSLRLIDFGVSSEQIELPDTNLTAGQSITVTKECVMGEEDILVHPVITYIAVQRQTETEYEETLTVASVIIGIKLDVQQFPSNEEGTTFSIAITNTGNRSMTNIQLYDEINSKIDAQFDLGPQQQKILTFQVPSAYASGLIRTVQFHLSCRDYFNNVFTYRDVNTYECVPYISTDSIRLSMIVELAKAYYDENNNLCGTLQFEIRNYSDVRVLYASVIEENLLGKITDFSELQRGETFYTSSYQLEGIESLSFRLQAYDTSGKPYETESIVVDLSQLESLASEKEVKPVIHHSNAFLKELIDKFTFSFKNIVTVALIAVFIGLFVGIILFIIEYRIRAKLPREALTKLNVPVANDGLEINPSMDQLLSGSPAEQLGYRAPAKIRYGDKNSIKPSNNIPQKKVKNNQVPKHNNSLQISKDSNKENFPVNEDINEIILNLPGSLSVEDIHPNIEEQSSYERTDILNDSIDFNDSNNEIDSYPINVDQAVAEDIKLDIDSISDKINSDINSSFHNEPIDSVVDNIDGNSQMIETYDSKTTLNDQNISKVVEFRPLESRKIMRINSIIRI